VQKRTLSNGLPVWIVEMHEVPLADLVLVVNAGASADPAGQFGVASFTAAMLDEGAGTRDALELADAIDFLGASITTNASFDASVVHLNTLTAKLGQALPLFADVALRPTFTPAEMDRVRQARLTSILETRDTPALLASAAFSRVLYGPTHRYGTPVVGTEAVNTALTASDLRAFYAAHYRPRNACLIVVGDVTTAALLPALERAFGGWRGAAAAAAPALPPAVPPSGRRIYLIDKPGAAQSEIRMGSIGAARDTPDYFAIDVMNTILGGSFTSRLNQKLRETHGYAYSAGSSFALRRTPGPFVAAAGVQTDKTVEALGEFFKELDGMRAPAPEEDVRRARNLEALSFPGVFETTSGMAGQLAELEIYDLPMTFFNEYIPRILAVTPADVRQAAGKYLAGDALAVVVVGDLATIEPRIRAANLGSVEVLRPGDVLN
jgi:predicted Zn-dependent peptidase